MRRLTPLRWAIITFVVWCVFVFAVIGVGQYLSHRDITTASRKSDVNSCLAANKAHDGVVKLVNQLVVNTTTSPVLTDAQKLERINGYKSLLPDFPALDCSANPIVFK